LISIYSDPSECRILLYSVTIFVLKIAGIKVKFLKLLTKLISGSFLILNNVICGLNFLCSGRMENLFKLSFTSVIKLFS